MESEAKIREQIKQLEEMIARRTEHVLEDRAQAATHVAAFLQARMPGTTAGD